MIKTAPSLICAMLLAIIPAFATAGGKHFNVTDFGAEARPEVINTQAIQSAIDAARKAGGGKVVVPAGTFVSGTLELYSHITLHLEEGAMIFGSADLADYRRGHWPALVMAKDAQHIGITGKGTLHGNSQELRKQFDRIRESGNALEFFPQAVEGEELDIIGPTGVVTRFNPYEMQQKGELMAYVYGNFTRPFEFVRPQIIEFWGCSHIEVRDITLRGAACWVQTYRNCTDILIQGIKVRSNDYWNNDGIDLVDCHRVRILDCDIDSADDALCLKSDPRGIGCEDIVVERCILATHASAVKFGTASHNTFKRIRISDIVVREAYRSVVAIQSVDGAVIDDVVIERVKAENVGNAFFFRLGHRSRHKEPGIIRNVIIRDMDVVVRPEKPGEHMDVDTPHNQIPSSIVGIPGHPVEQVTLENIVVRFPGGGRREHVEIPLDALESVPEFEHHYPEFSMWGELPAWGVYLRHANGVSLKNVKFELDNPDFRPAIVADQTQDLQLHRLAIGPGGSFPVVLRESPGASIIDPVFPEGSETVKIHKH